MSARMALPAAAAITFLIISAAFPAVAGWDVHSRSDGPWPNSSADWEMRILIVNTGNASLNVSDFVVWADWGALPTESAPARTSTALPVIILQAGSADFSFLIHVPTLRAEQPVHVGGRLVGSDGNGSGWTAPTPANLSGWDFRVLCNGPCGTDNTASPIWPVMAIGLFAAVIVMRTILHAHLKRGRRSPILFHYGPPPQGPGYPPLQGPGYAPLQGPFYPPPQMSGPSTPPSTEGPPPSEGADGRRTSLSPSTPPRH